MKLNRVKFSMDATYKLRQLKFRTGMTPNILSRLGFMLSLKEKTIPSDSDFLDDGMEINRHTLTGDHDLLYVALLRQRCFRDGIKSEKNIAKQFRAHMNRGAFLLAAKLTDIQGVVELIQE